MAEDDDYADAMGVINALERTCELEARLRQAIQATHPLTTTLDWDFSAADREREALLAISEQLEYLEDKLREYRHLDSSREPDNKAVVLSQLDNVRRELLDVTRNRAPHVTFGKEVVKEVLAFANVSDGASQEDSRADSPSLSPGGGARGEQLGAEGVYEEVHGFEGFRSPPPSKAAAGRGWGRVRTSAEGTSTWMGGLPRRTTSDGGPAVGRYAGGGASKSPPGLADVRRSGSGAPSPAAGAASNNPSRTNSPFLRGSQGGAGAAHGRYGEEGGRGRLRESQEGPPRGQFPATTNLRASTGSFPPRRQINLDIAAMNSSAGVGRPGGGARGYTYGGAGSGHSGGTADTAYERQQAQQAYYSFNNGNGSGGTDGGGGSTLNSARYSAGGGSSRPNSARTASQYDGAGGRMYGGGYRVGEHAQQGGYGNARAETSSRILNRLDPPPLRHRSASPMSIKAEDIYGAINGASRASFSQGGSHSGQQDYGGMVRIRDMLERAEKDLTRVQEEREQRRSPVPPRIFGEDLSNRVPEGDDAATPSGQPLSPSHSVSTGRRQPPAHPAGRRSEDSHSRLRSGAIPVIRDRADEGRNPESSTSGAFPGGQREGDSGGGGGGGFRWLGALIRQLAGMAIAGAALGLGAAAVSSTPSGGEHRCGRRLPHVKTLTLQCQRRGNSQRKQGRGRKGSVWVREHISARLQKPPAPKRDIPPWLVSAPPSPPPGSPQRAKQRRHTAGRAVADRAVDLPSGMAASKPYSRPPHTTPTPSKAPLRSRRKVPPQGSPPQSPVTHVRPLPEGDLFPSMPPPDVNVAKG